jgi:tRNA(fMet)-specific endonuclease VapC
MRHLDTSIVVAYLRGNGNVIRTLQAHFGDLAISAVVLAKLRFGACVSAHPEKNIQSVKDFLSLVHLIPFDEQSAMAYGDLSATL